MPDFAQYSPSNSRPRSVPASYSPGPVGPLAGLWDDSPAQRQSLVSHSDVKGQPPLTGSQMRQYSNYKPTERNSSQTSSGKSANAYAQALASQRSLQSSKTANDINLNYQRQKQQLDAADVYSKRADQVRRFGLAEGNRSDLRGQDVQKEQALANFAAQVHQAKLNADAQAANSALNLVSSGGLANLLTTGSQLYNAVGGLSGLASGIGTGLEWLGGLGGGMGWLGSALLL